MLVHLFWFAALSISFFSTNEPCLHCNKQNQVLCAPNTISLNPKICIDLTEVPGHMYKDFLQSLAEGENRELFFEMLPDFESWRVLFSDYTAAELEQKFFESDDFALLPIIGIRYEQALAFMDWRTEKLKTELAELSEKERNRFPKDFKFRLPSKKEWGLMRFRGQTKSTKKQLRKIGESNQRAFKLSRSKVMKNNELIHDTYFESDERIGFFNVYGNVSEMTLEKGLAVGGSWKEPNPAKQYALEYPYDGPNAWTGFRCVMEILD